MKKAILALKKKNNAIGKKLILMALSAVIVLSVCSFSIPFVLAEEPEEEIVITTVDGRECIAGEVLVQFEDTESLAQIESTIESLGSKIEEVLAVEDLVLTEVPEGETVESFIDELEVQPGVEFVQPNYIYRLDKTVSDPFAQQPSPTQWHLDTINAYEAWDTTMGVPSVTVAVLDTGVDLDHPDLAGQIYMQTDVVDNDGNANDDNGHGTHVCGIIGAATDNGVGVAGIAPDAQLMAIDVFTKWFDSGEGIWKWGASTEDIVEGINFAVANGADVINMSLGSYTEDPAEETAINDAVNAGVVVVASAGNDGITDTHYPSDFDACISVIWTNQDNTRNVNSNYGTHKDIASPGNEIVSTYWQNDDPSWQYASASGTSMAAPVVAGTVALMKSVNPSLTVAEIKSILYDSNNTEGPTGIEYGNGRVNAQKVVEAADVADDVIKSSGAYDISDFGNISTLTIQTGLTVTLTNRDNVTFSNAQLICEQGVDLTINNIKIDNSANVNEAALSFAGSGNQLSLAGISTLKSGQDEPGIRVETGTALSISGTGTVTAVGGSSGAGIGSGNGSDAGTITVSGGEITVIGGDNAAGIGGGQNSAGGVVSIEGGRVSAQKGASAPYDIGDGQSGSGGTLGISSDAIVFLKNNDSIVPTTTHTPMTFNTVANNKVVGLDIPSGWSAPIYAYINDTYLYDLTYDVNGGQGTPPDTVTQYKDTTGSIADGSALTNNEEVFDTWNDQVNGAGAEYEIGQQYAFTEDKTLYAIYREIIDATGVSLSKSSETIVVGDTFTLTETVSPSDASDKSVTWSTSNAGVATVTNGVVSAVGKGTATITVTTVDGGHTATCSVTVALAELASSSLTVDQANSRLTGVEINTSAASLQTQFDNNAAYVRVYDKNGAEYSGTAVATGMTVKLVIDGTVLDELGIVVLGDASGDGKIDISDYSLVRLDILTLQGLIDPFAIAGDINKDGMIDIVDYSMIRLDILGLQMIH